jgi:hypothetical protein
MGTEKRMMGQKEVIGILLGTILVETEYRSQTAWVLKWVGK